MVARTVDDPTEPYRRILDRSALIGLRVSRPPLRTTPTTSRGRDTVEHILAVAADLLGTVPVHDLTTHAVAAAAGVNIATLYRYFEDIESVLREIALRREIAQCERMVDAMPLLAGAPDWRVVVRGTIGAMGEMRRDVPEGRAIVIGLMTIPELRPVIDAGQEVGSLLTATALATRTPTMSADDWLPITRLLISTARNALDVAHAADAVDERRVELVAEMLIAFLERYLPD